MTTTTTTADTTTSIRARFSAAERNCVSLMTLAMAIPVDELVDLFSRGEVLLGTGNRCYLVELERERVAQGGATRVTLCSVYVEAEAPLEARYAPGWRPSAETEGPEDDLGITPGGYVRIAEFVREFVATHVTQDGRQGERLAARIAARLERERAARAAMESASEHIMDLVRSLPVDELVGSFARGERVLARAGRVFERSALAEHPGALPHDEYDVASTMSIEDRFHKRIAPPAEGPPDALGITPEGYQRVAAYVRGFAAAHGAR